MGYIPTTFAVIETLFGSGFIVWLFDTHYNNQDICSRHDCSASFSSTEI
jgi:hypothetical protein